MKTNHLRHNKRVRTAWTAAEDERMTQAWEDRVPEIDSRKFDAAFAGTCKRTVVSVSKRRVRLRLSTDLDRWYDRPCEHNPDEIRAATIRLGVAIAALQERSRLRETA